MSPLLITLVTLIIHLSQAQPSIRSVCLQEPDTGSCRAYLPSFYFNVQTGSCDCFVYGGCAPGGNNFESMETCMMTCGKTQATQVMSRDCRMILSNVNVARPVGPTQNGGQSSSSQSSGPPIGGSSVSNQRPDFNESTVQQLQTIFNEISASSRPSSTQEAIQPPQGQNQQPSSNQQRVPTPSTQQRVPPSSTQQRVPPPSGTTASRPVFPPPLPLPRPPPRQTPQSEKDFVLSKTKGDRRRPASSPRADQALQRQIEQQKELERQLQQTIQDHQQLQQQQQQQQQAQLLQQQLQQRQQHQQQLRKQQGAPV